MERPRAAAGWSEIFRPLLASALVIVLVLGRCSQPAAPAAAPATTARLPRVIPDASVGPDLAALTQDTWNRFLAAFRARTGCFGDVRLRAVYQLDSRAAYDPTSATVTVLVPGTPAVLEGELVHEWAHHLDFQCPAQRELRTAFLAAQGLPPDIPWRPAGGTADLPAGEWAGIPSEQFAEAAVEVVLGNGRLPTTVMITPQAVRLLAAWGAGR